MIKNYRCPKFQNLYPQQEYNSYNNFITEVYDVNTNI